MNPETKTCERCKKDFSIDTEDFVFYERMKVPPPRRCPDCRRRRRYSHQNMIKLYKRPCNVPGHTEDIITTTSPSVSLTVYDFDYYHSDAWDPTIYNRAIDVERPFFEVFDELVFTSPHPALRRGPGSTNAEYSLNGGKSKNIYYSSSVWDSEDIMYSFQTFTAKSCIDCYYSDFITNSYETVLSDNCYNVRYAYFSLECSDSFFLYDCRNCTNCFGCVNLRNKRYCFFNEQLTKQEYEEKMKSMHLGDRAAMQSFLEKFMDFAKSMPVLAERISKSVNATGNNIKNSNNLKNCFLISDSENCRYADSVVHSKDVMSVSLCGNSELCYESITSGGGSSNLKFCNYAKQCRDSEFLFNCNNCANCFGCFGLKNKAFHILNRPYEEEEYHREVAKIKERMLARGEYGEFFDETSSIYAYNSSYSGTLYPETKEEVLAWGGKWQDDPDPSIGTLKQISWDEIPSDIRDVTDEICSVAIIDRSGKPFRIVPDELAFYRRFSLPLPVDSPYVRIAGRVSFINYMHVEDDVCDSCGTRVRTATPHSKGYRPFCEKCYQQEVV